MTRAIIVLYLFLAGCATTAKYEAELAQWGGRSQTELRASWGEPTKILTASSGHLVYEYQQEDWWPANSLAEGHRSALIHERRRWCTTMFVIEQGRVVGWSWDGNNCRRV